MDTTPPEFTGSITVSLSGDYLVASWPSNAVSDSEELFDMNYEFAVGMSTVNNYLILFTYKYKTLIKLNSGYYNPAQPEGGILFYLCPSVLPCVQDIFCRIFLSNY